MIVGVVVLEGFHVRERVRVRVSGGGGGVHGWGRKGGYAPLVSLWDV